MEEPIYLDYNATTPLDPRVKEVLVNSLSSVFGNSSSSTHTYGWKADNLLKVARRQVASLIESPVPYIFFTSGATESNNTILRAVFQRFKSEGCHIITSQIEHKCILNCLHFLEELGCEVTYLPVDKEGRVKLDLLPKVIKDNTRLISIMGANNETGVIQDLKTVLNFAKENNILCHSDLAQYIGKIPFSVKELPFDFLSFSGHKFYGPKGVGAIYTKHASLLRKYPLMFGGGQEQSVRAGTVNTPAVIGFGEAARIAKLELESDILFLKEIKKRVIQKLKETIPSIIFNGQSAETLPGVVNFYVPGLASKDLLSWGKEYISLSTGSACTSVNQEPSHVLKAMGLSDNDCKASLRLSFGRFTSEEAIEKALQFIASGVDLLMPSSTKKVI